MTFSRVLLAIACCVGGVASDAGAQSSRDSIAVARTVTGFHAALAAGDSVRAMSMLTSDVVIMESGDRETRAEYRAHHLAADIEYARAVTDARSAVEVRVRGPMAWAGSTTATTGSFRGRAVNSAGAELMVLVREGSAWRIAAIHWSSHRRN